MKVSFELNRKPVTVDAAEDMPLLWAIRDMAGLTGTKFGCGMGLCGACTVLMAGEPVRSCITPAVSVAGKSVTTIEAAHESRVGQAVQQAWIAQQVPQCGYCQSGQIMSACGLLAQHRQPTDSQIDEAMAGNICRCGTYTMIRAAIRQAADTLR